MRLDMVRTKGNFFSPWKRKKNYGVKINERGTRTRVTNEGERVSWIINLGVNCFSLLAVAIFVG